MTRKTLIETADPDSYLHGRCIIHQMGCKERIVRVVSENPFALKQWSITVKQLAEGKQIHFHRGSARHERLL